MLAVWVLFFITIFSTLFISIKQNRNPYVPSENDQQVAVKRKGFQLPIGFYTTKQYIFFISALSLITLLAIGLSYYLNNYTKIPFVTNFLILFISFFILIMLVAIIHARYSLKPFTNFENDLDYPKVKTVFAKYEENNKLHPETRNFLVILQCNYTSNYDKEEAKALWKKVIVPTNSNYHLMYDLVVINRFIWQKDFTSARDYINNAHTNKIYAKQPNLKKALISRLPIIDALEVGVDEAKLDTLMPLKSKKKLLDIQNLALRVLYYSLRNNQTKAQEYFVTLKEMTPESTSLLASPEHLLNEI